MTAVPLSCPRPHVESRKSHLSCRETRKGNRSLEPCFPEFLSVSFSFQTPHSPSLQMLLTASSTQLYKKFNSFGGQSWVLGFSISTNRRQMSRVSRKKHGTKDVGVPGARGNFRPHSASQVPCALRSPLQNLLFIGFHWPQKTLLQWRYHHKGSDK